MTDEYNEFEEELKRLANRVQKGWAKMHPLSAKDLAAVRLEVRQHLANEKKAKEMAAKAQSATQSNQQSVIEPLKEKKRDQIKANQQDKDQSFEHGY